jgi:hypothetical protein
MLEASTCPDYYREVVEVGWPGCGLIAGSVTLGSTVPVRCTAAPAPVVS